MTGARSVQTLQIAHTADLDPAVLTAARTLLDEVFDNFTDHDWDHSLGGTHALLWEGTDLIGHAALVQRRLLHGRRALRTGYLEGVAVRADRRWRGHGRTLMDAVERLLRGAYELGALSASEAAVRFYATRGWQRWVGPTSALTPSGIVRTPAEDDSVFVLPLTAPLDLSAPLTCDWRDGDVW